MSHRHLPIPIAVFNDRFIFASLSHRDVASHARVPFCHPKTLKPVSLFTLDGELFYQKFARDHGPFNLASVYRACVAIYDRIHAMSSKEAPVCMYTTQCAKTKSNMLLIAALYFLIVGKCEPWDAFRPISHFEVMPFRDAGNGPMEFGVSIQDCLYGMYRAIKAQLIDLASFDLRTYTFYETVQNGDLNVLGPFIPFASPVEAGWVKAVEGAIQAEGTGKPAPDYEPSSFLSHAFKCVLKVFQSQNVGVVVRLNNELYDKTHFLERGMDHVEMYFDDGSNPSDEIVREFIRLSEETIEGRGQRVAVHCKAGLGRTGVLIGAYLIYKYQFSAQEVIAFMRVVRPGMVVGPQQQYMWTNQMKWVGWAAADQAKRDMAQTLALVSQPVQQLATPPAEAVDVAHVPAPPPAFIQAASTALDDVTNRVQLTPKLPSRLQPSSSLLQPTTLQKGGDAAGQPRKAPLRPTRSTASSERVVHPISYSKPSSSARTGSSASTDCHDSTSTPVPRGVKRTSSRSPVLSISSSTLSSPSRLVVPKSRLERSSSASSVSSSAASETERPRRKRPAYRVETSSVVKNGLSSPLASREPSPAEDLATTPRADSSMRMDLNKLRRRDPEADVTRPRTPPQISSPLTTPPPSASRRGSSPLTSLPCSEIDRERSYIPVPKRMMSGSQTDRNQSMLPTKAELADATTKRRGFSPPKLAKGLFGLGAASGRTLST